MFLRFFNQLRTVTTAVAVFGVLACCSPRSVAGLYLTVGPSVIAVSRLDTGDGPVVASDKSARFAFKQPIEPGASRDLVICAEGSGTLSVHLFSAVKDKQPKSSASFRLLEGKSAKLHIGIPEGVGISFVDLSFKSNGSAQVTAFSVEPVFIGARFDPTSYVVSSKIAYNDGSLQKNVTLDYQLKSKASLIIELANDGSAIISGVNQNGFAKPVFIVTVRAGDKIAIPLDALQSSMSKDTSTVSVESEQGLSTVLIMDDSDAPRADLHAILAVDAPISGDYALYRWDLFPETLVFDFANYAIQDSYLKRIAFFAEKPGFRGRIASDDEIRSLHGWNAHDYSTATLVAFFSKVQDLNFGLNHDEATLLEVLLAHGIITKSSSGVLGEGNGAIISISRESTYGLRRMFIDHESSHALFFQDSEYRKLATTLWTSLEPEVRKFWMQHLGWRRYDINDEYLCINELQAYLVQQPVSAVSTYYEALLLKLAEVYPADKARLNADSVLVLASVLADAKVLDTYLQKKWGLSAGNFGRLQKL